MAVSLGRVGSVYHSAALLDEEDAQVRVAFAAVEKWRVANMMRWDDEEKRKGKTWSAREERTLGMAGGRSVGTRVCGQWDEIDACG